MTGLSFENSAQHESFSLGVLRAYDMPILISSFSDPDSGKGDCDLRKKHYSLESTMYERVSPSTEAH